MLNENDLLGKPIVAYDSGKKIGSVARLIFDYGQRQLVAFVVNRKSYTLQILPWSGVREVNIRGVTTHSAQMIVAASDIFEVKRLLNLQSVTPGMCLQTPDQQNLGVITCTYFDKETGNITGYEVIREGSSTRYFVPVQPLLRIKDQIAIMGKTSRSPRPATIRV